MQSRNWPDIKNIKIEPANLLDENFPIFVSSDEERDDDRGHTDDEEEEIIRISDDSLFGFEDCLTEYKTDVDSNCCGLTDSGMGHAAGERTKVGIPVSSSSPNVLDRSTESEVGDNVIDIIDDDDVQFDDYLFPHFGKAALFEDAPDDSLLKQKQGNFSFDLSADKDYSDGHRAKLDHRTLGLPVPLSSSPKMPSCPHQQLTPNLPPSHKLPTSSQMLSPDVRQCHKQPASPRLQPSQHFPVNSTQPLSPKSGSSGVMKRQSPHPCSRSADQSQSRTKRAKLLKAEWIEDEDDDLMCLGIEESKWPEYNSCSSLFRDSKVDAIKSKMHGTSTVTDDGNCYPEKLVESSGLKDNLDDVDKYFSHKTDYESGSLESTSVDRKADVKNGIIDSKNKDIASNARCTKLYVCGICDKGFETASQLRKHVSKYKHKDCVLCAQCKETFNTADDLESHVKGLHSEKTHKCQQCSSAFVTLKRLKLHQNVHNRQKLYRCEICEATFTQSANLKIHLRCHTGQKPYLCRLCSSAFSHRSNLTRHMRSHSGQKPFVCGVCQSAFAVSSQLKVHTRLHSQEKPYKCHQCGSSFTQSAHLKNHIKTHSGEKNYACPDCPATFSEVSNLRVHQRVHNMLRPFSCNYCSSSFSQSSSLKRHIATHTGSNLHRCTFCSAAFKQPGHLKSHLLTHSDDKPWLKAKQERVGGIDKPGVRVL